MRHHAQMRPTRSVMSVSCSTVLPQVMSACAFTPRQSHSSVRAPHLGNRRLHGGLDVGGGDFIVTRLIGQIQQDIAHKVSLWVCFTRPLVRQAV